MPTPTVIQLSEARTLSRAWIDEHLAQGPITLIHYNKAIADIVPHVSELERKQAQRAALTEALELVRLCDGDAEMMQILLDLGLDSRAEIETLLSRARSWKATYGYSIDCGSSDLAYVEEKMPEVYRGNLGAILAHLHIDPDNLAPLHAAGGDIVAWSNAVATIQHAAIERGDRTSLMEGFRLYDSETWEEEESLGATLLATGLSPEEFTQRALALIGQGVAATDIIGAFDADAVPTDILAMGTWTSGVVADLRKEGVPMADAYTLIRHYGDTRGTYSTICILFRYGVTDMHTLRRLVDGGVKLHLAGRAHQAGLSPQDWMPQLDTVGRYAYKRDGDLPWSLLVTAAQEGLSLTAWDKLPERPESKGLGRPRYLMDPPVNTRYGTADEPFCLAYFDRVIELARLGITPGYLLACWNLRPWIPGDDDRFVDQVIDLKTRGLRLDVVRHLHPFVGELSKEAGIFLLNMLADHQATLGEVSELGQIDANSAERFLDWRKSLGLVPAFLDTLTEEQRKLVTLASNLVKSMENWRRRHCAKKIADEAVELLSKHPQRMHIVHLFSLIDVGSRNSTTSQERDGMQEIPGLFSTWLKGRADSELY
jgi:hypothetical protein